MDAFLPLWASEMSSFTSCNRARQGYAGSRSGRPRLRNGRSPAESFAPTVTVDANGDDDGDQDDAVGPLDLYVGRVHPAVGPADFDRAIEKGLQTRSYTGNIPVCNLATVDTSFHLRNSHSRKLACSRTGIDRSRNLGASSTSPPEARLKLMGIHKQANLHRHFRREKSASTLHKRWSQSADGAQVLG